MRQLLILALMSLSACNSGCATSPTVVKTEQAAVACLPQALPRILACHTPAIGDAAAEAVCVIVEVTKLWQCWTSQPAPVATQTPAAV